jgi:hypothetical protein
MKQPTLGFAVQFALWSKLFPMNAYSKYITVDNRQIEVKFVKIETSHPQKFSITVVDFEKIDIAFHVAKDSYGKWNLLQPIPASLLGIKSLLLDLIKDHSKN